MTTSTLNPSPSATTTKEGLRLKAEGQAKAEAAASEWSVRALEVITDFANSGAEFTSEDVTNVVGLPSGGTGLNENNAVGSVFSHANRKGIIEWTGRLNKSSREERHASDLRVWRKADPANPIVSGVDANMLRRLSALANRGMTLVEDPDQEWLEETQKMISKAKQILVSSH